MSTSFEYNIPFHLAVSLPYKEEMLETVEDAEELLAEMLQAWKRFIAYAREQEPRLRFQIEFSAPVSECRVRPTTTTTTPRS